MYRIDVTPLIGVLLASVAAFVAAVIPEQQLNTTEVNVPRCLDSHCYGYDESPDLATPNVDWPFAEGSPKVRYVTFEPAAPWGEVIARIDAIRAAEPSAKIAIDAGQP